MLFFLFSFLSWYNFCIDIQCEGFSTLFFFRIDFMQNPLSVPRCGIPPRRNPGVLQQRAIPIPPPSQASTSDQSSNLVQPIMPQIGYQQVPQAHIPSSSVQPIGPAQPVAREVYTMADFHNLAVTQGRRLVFCRRRDGSHSHPQHQ